MTCSICGQEEATIHIKQISEGSTVELHLCENCATDRGIGASGETAEFSISNLLTGLVENKKGSSKRRKACPQCGMTLEILKKRAKLGCNECYTVFAKEIRGIIGRMYGQTQHRGKLPKRLKAYKTLLIDVETLRTCLGKAIKNEDYEEAARLRDQISELKGQAGDG